MEKIKINMQIDDDEKILSSMKQAYYDCPEAVKYCSEIGISQSEAEDNITKLYDFVCDKNYCKNCPGMNKCQKNNPLLISKPVYKNGVVSIQMSPCKEFIRQMRFEKQFLIRDCPTEWLEKKLRDVKQNTLSKKKAVKKYIDYLNQIDSGWIYSYGGIGAGKSFLGAVMAADAATRDLGSVLFLDSTKRFRELVDLSYKKTNEFQETLDKYCDAKVLVLDNFGNEFKNDFVRDAIVYPIIANRASKNLFTIIISDFTIKEIETLYSTSKSSEIRAKQIAKILKSKCDEEINFDGVKTFQ